MSARKNLKKFRGICFNYGVRSLSELARAVINMLVEQPARAQEESLASRVAELEGRIGIFSLELKKLNRTAKRAEADAEGPCATQASQSAP